MRRLLSTSTAIWVGLPGMLGGGAAPAQDVALPEAAGRRPFQQVCLQCHPVELVVLKRHSEEEWQEIIVRMREHGAKGTDQQFQEILIYLASNFGSDASAAATIRAAPAARAAPVATTVASR